MITKVLIGIAVAVTGLVVFHRVRKNGVSGLESELEKAKNKKTVDENQVKDIEKKIAEAKKAEEKAKAEKRESVVKKAEDFIQKGKDILKKMGLDDDSTSKKTKEKTANANA